MFASAGISGTVGRAFLLVGFIGAVFGAFAAFTGARRNDPQIIRLIPRFSTLSFAAAVGAFAAMEYAMITRDFSLAYVQKVGSWSTPALYNFAAVWSALEGSILMWVLVLAGYTAAVSFWVRKRMQDLIASWALGVMFVVSAFFFLVSFFPANPFAAGAPGVLDGPGPNPLLQNHILVMFHPPILYLGYVGVTVPFAFAIAALITGRVGEGWLVATRRWSLFAWGFLTFGIALGSWWSYEVLGWSGVWAWDPVENASLLPWITGTAYIHSVLVQERRGMLRVWNISLLVATFSLTILGTFLTRSGVLNSVHAFSESSIGSWFLGLFAVVLVVSIGLIGWRGDKLRSPGVIDSPLSREAAFLANNVLFAVFAFVVLLGTVFPLIIEALQNRQIAVGAPFFDKLSMPIGLALLTLMAIAPVLPWRKASTETLRQRLFWPAWCGVAALVASLLLGAYGLAPLLTFTLGGVSAGAAMRQVVLATRRQGWRGLVGRANGGMIVHLGVILIAVALGASNSFSKSQELSLVANVEASFSGHTFELKDVIEVRDDRSISVKALVLVDGKKIYAPAITKYTRIGMNVGTPSVRTSLTTDIYLTLEPPVRQDANEARIKVFIKPMIIWLWIGTALMAVGTVLAAFPGRRRKPTDATSAPVEVAAS
ncbi:MAG: heme lyase CcmF/NrfE family subunit [Ilumatobacteraceae bacterium]|nr:heme lyase CcmF/NrfE family subunit [Ilumatobacteraceae bacterium]